MSDVVDKIKAPVSDRELKMAAQIIDSLTGEWDPERYHDRYRRRLQTVVARKRKGQTVKAPAEAKAAEPVPDLMEALERTLAELR